ncbi:Defensin precursor, putative [Pediculus humanus corporis]|uniref:Defensin, putative n=1 Tax=Pediculus humanus subsp. corporis TaxID=121224 RepID=E0VPU4_PEDHC|nr:Defensin precursor, putative [Pediculus humanus corporis]EEB15400.1 Defensin precursor, putative [Pediculus humanus corporis]
MNGLTIVFFLFAIFMAFVSAVPVLNNNNNDSDADFQVEEYMGELTSENVDLNPVAGEEDAKGRFRRATCDLLSASTPWGSLNHSACAAHCLTKRYKGGRCRNGICRCRR